MPSVSLSALTPSLSIIERIFRMRPNSPIEFIVSDMARVPPFYTVWAFGAIIIGRKGELTMAERLAKQARGGG